MSGVSQEDSVLLQANLVDEEATLDAGANPHTSTDLAIAWGAQRLRRVLPTAGAVAVVLAVVGLSAGAGRQDTVGEDIASWGAQDEEQRLDLSSAAGQHVVMMYGLPLESRKQMPTRLPARTNATRLPVGEVISLYTNEHAGISYIRKGYNCFRGNPISKGTDPGFVADVLDIDIDALKKGEDVQGVSLARSQSCSRDMHASNIKTSAEFTEALETNVQVDVGQVASAVAGVTGAGPVASAAAEAMKAASFNLNKEVQSTKKQIQEGELSVSLDSGSCEVSRATIQTMDAPKLTAVVQRHLDELEHRDPGNMIPFFDSYGTHYVAEMVFGHRWVARSDYRKTLDGSESSHTDSNGAEVGGSSGSTSSESSSAQSSEQAARTMATWTTGCIVHVNDYDEFVGKCGQSTEYKPVPVQYRLAPLSTHPDLSPRHRVLIDKGLVQYCVRSTPADTCPPAACTKHLKEWCPSAGCQQDLVKTIMIYMFIKNFGPAFKASHKMCHRKADGSLDAFSQCVAGFIRSAATHLAHVHVGKQCGSLAVEDMKANTDTYAVRHTQSEIANIIKKIVLKAQQKAQQQRSWFFR